MTDVPSGDASMVIPIKVCAIAQLTAPHNRSKPYFPEAVSSPPVCVLNDCSANASSKEEIGGKKHENKMRTTRIQPNVFAALYSTNEAHAPKEQTNTSLIVFAHASAKIVQAGLTKIPIN